MSFKLNLNESDKKQNTNSKEYKWKELLYELFYEIKSEILGCKIEIEEEEYQENVRTITIPKLVNYIHDSIKILIQKKIDDTKAEQKEEDEKFFMELNLKKNTGPPLEIDDQKKYENIIKKLEAKERILTKIIFQYKLQKTAMENKIGEYMEMEEEFEEMKTKLKYEEGRFLKNDRKDNEIIIIRGENSNLKQIVGKLEEKLINLEKDKLNNNKIIHKFEDEIKKLRLKVEDLQKQNEILNAHSINININNVTGAHNKNGAFHNSPFSKNIKDKIFPFKKIKNKFINSKKQNPDVLSKTRNESLERTKSDLINKYFTGNKKNGNAYQNNGNNVKANQFNYVNNLNGKNINNNNNNANMPLLNNMSNFNIIKKIISMGNSNNIRSNSTKVKGNSHRIIDYKPG